MNPFGNFKFNQYQQQFAPLPARDIIQSSNQLHQEALRNEASMDKIKQLANQINVLDEDAYIKKAQLDELDRIIAEAEKTGAWEHAGKMARESARNFANNRQLASAQKNYAGFQALLKEANEMDVSDFQRSKIQDLRRNYKGTGSADEFGNYKNIGSVNLYEEHDIMQEVFDNLAKKKADGSVVPYKEGYWLVTATNEIRSEQELYEDGVNWVMSQPKYRTQMRDMVMHRATGGDLSKDVTPEDYEKTYKQVASELVAPSAGILEYQKQGLSYKADPMEVDSRKRARDLADQSIVGISEITPTEVPTFEENLESLKSIEAQIAQTQNQINREGGAVNEDLTDKMDGLQKQKAKMLETVNQEIDNITNEMNEVYGLEGKDKITPEVYKDMMANYGDKTGFTADVKSAFQGLKSLIYSMTPMGMQSKFATGISESGLYDEKQQRDKEYYNSKFSEKQRKAFDLYHGNEWAQGRLPKRQKKSRKGQYELGKTKSTDAEILYFNQKESKSFAPYIMQEAMKDNAFTTKGERIDSKDLAKYKLDNTRNAGIYSTKINGKEYLQVPVLNDDDEQVTILVDGSQITSDGGTLYTHAQNIIQQRVNNLKQNMGGLDTYGQQQAKTFINAAEPIIDPTASEYTNFIQEVNNLRPRTQTTAGKTYGMTSYGSTETKIGNTGFISMNRIGESSAGFYLGSKSSGGQEYIFSFDDNTGNDKYGKQNGIVKDYINIEGASNMQTNTNNAAKGKRLANVDYAIRSIDQIPTSTNVSNWHTLSKLSEFSRNNNVSLSEADVNQIEEMTPALVSVLETNGYNVSVPELDINDSKSVQETVSFYHQTLQLIATEYGKQ